MNLFGASIIVHEKDHAEGGGELSAYTAQIAFLSESNVSKQFKNQAYLKAVKDGLQKTKSTYEPEFVPLCGDDQ